MTKKILIVEDEEEAREVIVFIVNSKIKAEIFESSNGHEAIEKIKENPDLDLIVCDYRMPDSNGYDVYKYIKDNNLSIPFVLCSADTPSSISSFKNEKIVNYIIKPFISKGISDVLLKVFSSKDIVPPEYVPLNASIFKNIPLYPADLYIKLSSEKYVKIFKKGSTYEEMSLEKYKSRGVKYLYVKGDQSEILFDSVQNLLKDILNRNQMTSAKKIKTVFEIVHSIADSYGFKQEVLDMVSKTISETVDLVKDEYLIQSFINEILQDENSYLSIHSSLIPLISCSLASKMDFKSKNTVHKLTLASFMHDITIKNDNLAKIKTMEELEKIKDKFPKEEIDRFKRHPVEAGNLLRNMKNIPPDVDRIVLEHHELPDGSGFPRKLDHQRIGPLSTIFILSHLVADELYWKRSKIDIVKFIDEDLKHLQEGHFIDISEKLKSIELFKS